MGARANGRALLIFDVWLHVDLVFSKALTTRHVEVGQHGELDLRMRRSCLRIASVRRQLGWGHH
jgi:hypothetical protein